METHVISNIEQQLQQQLPSWQFRNKSINKEFTFKNFVEAFAFMTAIALEAEKLDHHPDWSNVYNKVNISLSTYSAGNVTDLDFNLATRIETIYAKIGGK